MGPGNIVHSSYLGAFFHFFAGNRVQNLSPGTTHPMAFLLYASPRLYSFWGRSTKKLVNRWVRKCNRTGLIAELKPRRKKHEMNELTGVSRRRNFWIIQKGSELTLRRDVLSGEVREIHTIECDKIWAISIKTMRRWALLLCTFPSVRLIHHSFRNSPKYSKISVDGEAGNVTYERERERCTLTGFCSLWMAVKGRGHRIIQSESILLKEQRHHKLI